MRGLLTFLFTILAGVGMIVAVPTMWATTSVISEKGFAAAAESAARQPEVQRYFATQIAEQAATTTGVQLAANVVAPIATAYTQSPAFVEGFTNIAQQQHRWLFTEPAPGTSPHQMDLDITPMVNAVLARTAVPVTVSQKVTVTLDQSSMTAGSLRQPGQVVTLLAWVSMIGAAVSALFAILLGRNRLSVIAWLGLGAVAAGIVGTLVAKFLNGEARKSAEAAEPGVQATVQAVASDMLSGLTTASLVVGAVGIGVAALCGLGAMFFRR